MISISGADAPNRRFAQSLSRVSASGNAADGYLTNSDLTMLKAVSGEDFAWPPKQDSIVPRAALDLSSFRQKQAAAGSVLADLTTQDLASLKRQGVLQADFVAKAIDYLQGNAAQSNTAPSTGDEASSTPRGDTDGDGAIYL